MHERLDGVHRVLVHHFERRRDHSLANDRRYCAGRLRNCVENPQQSNGRFGLVQQAHDHLGDDRQGALGPDYDAGEVVTGRIRGLATQP